LLERLNTVLDHYMALLAGHLENRSGSSETNAKAEAQEAYNNARRVADELDTVFGADAANETLPEAAE
jgi:hypothetical protein